MSESAEVSNQLMIALYYWYINIPIPSLNDHVSFHESLCKDLNLFGRIRISTEGLNGVLSGTARNLKSYEVKIRSEIETKFRNIAKNVEEEEDDDDDDDDVALNLEYGQTLDVKYCHLRKDIPPEKQLFDSLSVKVTKEVVSLNEEPDESKDEQSRNKKQPKKKKKRSRKKNKGDRYEQIMEEDRRRKEAEQHQLQELQAQQQAQQQPVSTQDQLEKEALSKIDDFKPCTHLTPQEWNEHLLNEQNKNDGSNNNAILIDARNIYESKIGYFSSKNVPTLLTNTRKYSTITSVFNESIEHLAGKNVYMYCTGGVRCERASVYLQAMAKSEAWPDNLERPKSIYQLQGGIQKYLEQYGHLENTRITKEHKDCDDKNDNNDCVNDMKGLEISSRTDQKDKEQIGNQCLFKGKNFVFDPRRYDPVVGNDEIPVGKCIVCSEPCDDYDNNYAPCENMETRCCRCRVLVLICNECRPKVRAWGQELNDDLELHPADVFCGPGGKECIDEGNYVSHYEIVHS